MIGDIWIPNLSIPPNHFARFYMHGVKDIFQIGDLVFRVEHIGARSRLMSHKTWHDS
jgi:hypothetical protein